MTLTDLRLKSLKGREKAYKVADRDGLYVLVQPSGSRLWRMNYTFARKQRTLAFGPYPQVTLAEAREKCADARKQIRNGQDPAALRREAKWAAPGVTFGEVSQELIDKMGREQHSKRTMQKNRWFRSLALPAIGDRSVGVITPPEILAMLRKIDRTGRYETVKRLRAFCGRVFRFAIATGRAQLDPTAGIRVGEVLTTPRTKHRPAIIEPARVSRLLTAIDCYRGQPGTSEALQLLALTFVRPGSLRPAEWREIDFDEALWIIPTEHLKHRRADPVPPLYVPLARQTIEVLKRLHAITGKKSRIIPGAIPGRPMSENTLNAALRRMGYDTKAEHCAHGFRTTASSLLNESRLWHPDAIERQLAHIDRNSVRRAYARGEYWDERVRMMQWWADKLDELRKADPLYVPPEMLERGGEWPTTLDFNQQLCEV